ncbi:hypothetical protein GQ44DRAFT_772784 [Phaeosphaeriaceae sp. PMI808]|nr:hypothetical protein GQ44DRAFT_772784 [Phaeosphaeriaceae sp. PMI808]
MATAPFRFLDLPKELRLMIYERIPITTKHHTMPNFKDMVRLEPRQERPGESTSRITIVTKSFPLVGILSTCRCIHNEAKAFLHDTIRLLKADPLCIIVDMPQKSYMFKYYMCKIIDEIRRGRMLSPTSPFIPCLIWPEHDEVQGNAILQRGKKYFNSHDAAHFMVHIRMHKAWDVSYGMGRLIFLMDMISTMPVEEGTVRWELQGPYWPHSYWPQRIKTLQLKCTKEESLLFIHNGNQWRWNCQ